MLINAYILWDFTGIKAVKLEEKYSIKASTE
jgi:hypothetical protein